MQAIKTAANIVRSTSWLIPLLTSSTPPLKPIASNKYNENNFGIGGGISKSDLTNTAIMPKKKNKIGGLRTLETIRSKSIGTDPHKNKRISSKAISNLMSVYRIV